MLVVTKMESKIGESLRSISLPDGEIYLTDMSNRVLASTTNSTGEVIVLPDGSEAGDPEGTEDIITDDFIYVVNNNHAFEQKAGLQGTRQIPAPAAERNETRHSIHNSGLRAVRTDHHYLLLAFADDPFAEAGFLYASMSRATVCPRLPAEAVTMRSVC
ncbi:hypothetical protein ACFSQ7_17275 [Paenibacillus rhizoplanae]